MHNSSALIFAAFIIIFTLGKSPIFRVDRAGASIIGAVSLIGFGVLTFDDNEI